ncbi:hypothetical protein G155_00143 [Mycobacterium sp. VKM Ac-1817D]|nr:hypothetical protein G155_00143 [Mycobacterium sp. VKM Ac-1817D]
MPTPQQLAPDRNSRLYITTRPIESEHKFHRGASGLSVVAPVRCPKTSVIIHTPCPFRPKTELLNPEETRQDSTGIAASVRTSPYRPCAWEGR